jgi:hypothetical protein
VRALAIEMTDASKESINVRSTARAGHQTIVTPLRSLAQQVLLLEFNEVNFEHARVYIERKEMPNLARLIEAHGYRETSSELRYEELEPWIQWVTAHSGLPYARHGVFRLGDIVKHDIPQIWEVLEDYGLTVGAISPMNAKNRTRDAAFFVPDPWTPTSTTGSALLKRLHAALTQGVNDNATEGLQPRSAIWLLAGLARYARSTNYGEYVRFAASHRAKPWYRAMFLDLLLADVFMRETQRTMPNFVSLFLNAAAHIQHHYMFNSMAYKGEQRNPSWYIAPKEDPVGDVYRLYDRILGQVQRRFPGARLMIATGLHQDPHSRATFYWRLKDHSDFLRRLGVPFKSVQTRMSRDFVVECVSEGEAAEAARVIASARAANNVCLFEVDNRGRDLFVMLTWPYDIPPDFAFTAGERRFDGLRNDVAFVAIKNGQHNGTGYFVDTGATPADAPKQFPLANLPELVCDALGVAWDRSQRTSPDIGMA